MTNQQIQIFTSADGQARLEVAIDRETVWLSLDQMTDLFDRDKSVISRHIRNVLAEGELEAVVAKFAHTAEDGKTSWVDCCHLAVDSLCSILEHMAQHRQQYRMKDSPAV